jgi:hypothetical protein
MLTTTAISLGAIHVDRGVGYVFMDENEAEVALQQLEPQTASSGSIAGELYRVYATTLDDVYYPLIAQRGKAPPLGEFSHVKHIQT